MPSPRSRRRSSQLASPKGRAKPPVRSWTAGIVLALAGFALAAYHNTFSAPFVFDDLPGILGNSSLRQLWPPWSALWPPADAGWTVSGRPILNLSLAINYAISGADPWSYHAFNLAIHFAAGLVLWGIVRRTLERTARDERDRTRAPWIAASASALWLLHPLTTAAVTYVIQRAESLAALFYLLTIYAVLRSSEDSRRRWSSLAIAACLFGMATKETVASAPVVAWLYDRTFLAGSFRGAWRARRRLYLGLASTWLVLLVLVLATGGRAATAGFESGPPWWQYALTQAGAIVHYLRLALWPTPLVFDYGTGLVANAAAVAPQLALVALLVLATVVALVRRPVAGFFGACFFLILAPSSSIVPIATQTMAEHRMYLPLASLVVALVWLLFRIRFSIALLGVAALVAAAGAATHARNRTYRSALDLWADTVAKQPDNPRARDALGSELLRAGRLDAAIAQLEAGLRLNPDDFHTHNDLGIALDRAGRPADAIAHFDAALRLRPGTREILLNRASAHLHAGREHAAFDDFSAALESAPDSIPAHLGLAETCLQLGRTDEAIAHLETARRLKPDDPDLAYRLGNALARTHRTAEAIACYETSLRLRPDFVPALNNLGNALLLAGRPAEAVPRFRSALALAPDPMTRANLGLALLQLRDFAAAAQELAAAAAASPPGSEQRRRLERAQAQAARAAQSAGAMP